MNSRVNKYTATTVILQIIYGQDCACGSESKTVACHVLISDFYKYKYTVLSVRGYNLQCLYSMPNKL
jgi:hypothetical protein